MTFRLPLALQTPDDDAALKLLGRYFHGPSRADGAEFDIWAPDSDPDRFTADDLIAIKFLSVEAPKDAVRALLRDRADEFAKLLTELGPDRDLADEPPLDDNWVGWTLMNRLRSIDKVGTTTASKLLARKRPRLRPIWDSVVAEVTDSGRQLWEPLRAELAKDDKALHHRLVRLHREAKLPDEVSPLRVFDVIAWREGKDRGF
ncbi:hypothetical protein JIG36_08600 [Actinoplanes sp. LDG1-06]|uniref:Uncharacterized protein n=1 Tax=Paractinoplanes ovalisporus TaxID=2810368 RepID=A0ABS2A8I5_9ACTN|nr:DUF6308 family protein [Actinoplanes ovalisporus]MBM2615623.1 hypothetical protein [Actinoplanes ovalisporus]